MDTLGTSIGDEHFVHCPEVVPSSEVKGAVNIVGRLSTLPSVHYSEVPGNCYLIVYLRLSSEEQDST